MLSKDIPGSIIICLILFVLLGFGFSLLSIDWSFFFKLIAAVAAIAGVVGLAAAGRDAH